MSRFEYVFIINKRRKFSLVFIMAGAFVRRVLLGQHSCYDSAKLLNTPVESNLSTEIFLLQRSIWQGGRS